MTGGYKSNCRIGLPMITHSSCIDKSLSVSGSFTCKVLSCFDGIKSTYDK